MWRNSRQIRDDLKNRDGNYSEKLDELFALHMITKAALPIVGYSPPTALAEALVLSPHGREAQALVEGSDGPTPRNESIFALVRDLYHHDIYFDLDKSDIDAAISAVEAEIMSKKIKLPYRYGRELYDKFHDDEFERSEHLKPEEVDLLISSSDFGVYQIGKLVTGPLGIIRSSEGRYIPPTRSLPLWHCEDTGCRHVHIVRLLSHQTASEKLTTEIIRRADAAFGPASEWALPLAQLHRRDSESRSKEYHDIVSLIADTVSGNERTSLLSHALSGSMGKEIRATLSTANYGPKGSGPADELAISLTPASQLQLLMTLDDRQLVHLIDSCIRSRIIDIPPTETRSASASPRSISSFDLTTSMSMFGVRPDFDHPPLMLSSIIWKEYEKAGSLGELAWRCRRDSDSIHPDIVLDYLKEHGAREAVRNLLLSSHSVALAVSDRMNVALSVNESQDETISRILWKFGFNPPRYDQKYSRLRTQLSSFREELLRYRGSLTDDDRDSIRSVGVNVFVSLENILEEMISYNVWLMSQDHFLGTRFVYARPAAVTQVSSILGEAISAGGQNFRWSNAGGNTLGTLMLYARATAEWLQSLPSADREACIRPPDDLPHYIDDRERRFKFLHTQFWADTNVNSLSSYAQLFASVISMFEQAKLAEVRNGLDHYREERKFPAVDLMLACESRVSAAFDLADVNRLIPKAFWASSESGNADLLNSVILVDYLGRQIMVSEPSSVSGLPSASYSRSFAIPAENLLGLSNAAILIPIREESDYSRAWADYPRRINSRSEAI